VAGKVEPEEFKDEDSFGQIQTSNYLYQQQYQANEDVMHEV
jgi:hypothetical protein